MNVTKLICVGDSITWGYPFGPEYSWVNLAAKELGMEMINRGINGNTAEDLVNRFSKHVLSHNPSHVLVMVGANDASVNLPLQEYGESVTTMFNQAKDSGISTIIALPVPSLDKWLEYTLEKYRYWLRGFASANNIPTVDFSASMSLADGRINPVYFVDDVHPSKAGYRVIADNITKFFRYCKLEAEG